MTATTRISTLIILNVYFSHVLAIEQTNHTKTCVQWYESGVNAYLENRWVDCVNNFETALDKYREFRKMLKDCRLKCKSEAELSEPLYPIDIDNLLFYERAIRQTLCIIGCQNESPHISDNYMEPAAEKLFEEQKPYEYLHLCYYQMKDLQKAASSAFTFLVSNPEDEIMQNNLKHYSEMKEVDTKKIVNYEAKDYVYLYVHGADAYEKKDWKGVINNMEESLDAYLQTEEECRALCEGPFDHGWYPDFIPSISNHFTVCLKCKQKCRKKLSSLNGEIHDDLLPSHYHYLQYAYFKVDNLKAACQAVASYLLFYPDDNSMLENMKFYSKLPKVQDDFFRPREEAIRYLQRHIYESKIMKYITEKFKGSTTPQPTEKARKLTPHITMTEKHLHGTKRFVSDGLASTKDCKSLIKVAKLFAELGDGYEGNISPHTVLEKFEGITLGRAVFLTYYGLLHQKYIRLYLKVTEEVLKQLQDYFRIEETLYFSYTQLVCRSALTDSPENRTDFSHKIHADNCNILRNGTCTKTPPAFTWRNYSAILYLNDDFDGGEFIFSSDEAASHIQGVVEPKCGRMVAFSSGSENLHGVKAVRKGSRCALAIWFTHDPKYIEDEREIAQYVLEEDLNFHSVSLEEVIKNDVES